MKLIVRCGVALLCAHAMSVTGATTVRVAPTGDDANPGTVERPLGTPTGARDAVRRLRAANWGRLPAGGVEIVFADGTYPLAEPLCLTHEDSGSDGAPITWRAEHRGRATWSGAIRPAARRVLADPDVLARLPAAARGKIVEFEFPEGTRLPGFTGGGCGTSMKLTEYPISVFQGDRRLELARWPRKGFARTGDNIGAGAVDASSVFSKTLSKSGRFHVDAPADRLKAWSREADLWTFGLWNYQWADATVRVRAVKPSAQEFVVDPAPIGFGVKVGALYYVFNALCELAAPGQWVVDRARRRVYVWPLAEGEVRIAYTPGLLRALRVRDVRIEGLVFEHARELAVEFRDSTNCAVIASATRHTSAWAISMANCRDCRVAGCDLEDLGRGGILLSGGDLRTLAPGGNVADNNRIGHYGKVIYNYQPGVQLTGVGNRATHNLIHHSNHQAISFGGNDHRIAWNVIHDMCMFNDDAGAVYCCQRDWTQRGTVIEHNLIHMTGNQPRCAHVNGIYLDDYSSGVIVRGNLINRAALGIYIGGGQDNVLDGNIVMNCPHGISLGSRGADSFARNLALKGRDSDIYRRLDARRHEAESPLWRARYSKLLRVDGLEPVFAHNALWNVITNNVLAGCGGIATSNWEKVGATTTLADNLELAGDPGFVDYFAMDWELAPGSAARARVGETGASRMGLYASDERLTPPVRFGPGIMPPRRFGFEYAPATARIDVQFQGELPTGFAAFARPTAACDLPDWAKGRRIMADFGKVPYDGWVRMNFEFLPLVDGCVSLMTMGARGEKTLYDDFRVVGAMLRNGGFEEAPLVWHPGRPSPTDYRAPICNTNRPWGVVGRAETGVEPAEGARMACGSDMINFSQGFEVRKGVPVRVVFRARALPLDMEER